MIKMRLIFQIVLDTINRQFQIINALQIKLLKMVKKLLIFQIILNLVLSFLQAPKGCTPFGLRLALGRHYFKTTQNQILSIRFNTQLECNQSFVTITKDSAIKKIYCPNKKVSFENYTSYIHKCSIDFLFKGDTYEYMAFGWTGRANDSAIPFKNSNIKSHLIKDRQSIKMVVLADWGYLEEKANIYNRLDNAFNAILKQPTQPDVVYLGGDFAYDLSTNQGRSYQSFLVMLSQISAVWPCILITGNHEYYTANDYMLFDQSFELYDITKDNATAIDLGGFYFVLADPYGILYQNATTTHLLAKFKTYLDKAPKSKPLIVTTHYPLACSGASTHCKNQRFILKQFFDMMIDYGTTFYIGAHYHTYQRLFPYVKGGNFQLIPSPYTLTKNTKYLVSVVEGIAGNDKNIVQQYGKLQNYTAALSYNKTGYGIMMTNNRILNYYHYIATDWSRPVDSLTIDFDGILGKERTYLREQ